MQYKRLTAGVLALSLSAGSLPVRAADSEYLNQARLLKQAIDQLANYQYQVKFSQAILAEQMFTTDMVELVNRDLITVSHALNGLENQRSKILDNLGSLDASTFMSLNQNLAAWIANRTKVEAQLKKIEKAGQAVTARESFFDRFCVEYPNLVRPDTLVYQPLNFGVATGVDYSKYSTVFTNGDANDSRDWIFSQDPKVEAETIIGSSATALITLAAISIVYDVLPISFLTLKSISEGITLSASIALGGSSTAASAEAAATAAAGTAMTAAAVVIVVAAIAYSEWRTSKENSRRQAEAEKKYDAELAQFNEAQSWYNGNRLTHEQLVALAQETCSSEKIQKMQTGYRNQFDADFSTSIQFLLAQIRTIKGKLDSTEHELKAGVDQCEKEFSKLLTAEAMDSLKMEIIAAQEVSNIWLIFNEQIKPLLDQHHQRLVKEGCNKGAENWQTTEAALKMSSDQITSTINVNSPKQQEAWGEVQKRAQRLQSILQNRFAGCPTAGGNIYDF